MIKLSSLVNELEKHYLEHVHGNETKVHFIFWSKIINVCRAVIDMIMKTEINASPFYKHIHLLRDTALLIMTFPENEPTMPHCMIETIKKIYINVVTSVHEMCIT